MLRGGIDIRLGDQALVISILQVGIDLAAVQVAAHFDCQGGGFRGGIGDEVAGVEEQKLGWRN